MQLQRRPPGILKLCAILLLLTTLLETVASVPTSVLVQNSELSTTNNDIASLNSLKFKNNEINKEKRSSNEENSNSQSPSTSTASTLAANNDMEKKSSPEVVPASFDSPPQRSFQDENTVLYRLPENSEAGVAQGGLEQTLPFEEEPSTSLYKRGISSAQQQAYSYGSRDGFSNPFLSSSLPAAQLQNSGGVWADELDPVSSNSDFNDLQELGDYAPVLTSAPIFRNKAYDNLQNILNTDAYFEPMALPYSGRYYGVDEADRRKRSNPSKLNRYAELRSPKRDAKLTPADMLALVALVEAGERARKESEPENTESMYSSDGISFRNSVANSPDLYDSPITTFSNNRGDDNSGTISFYKPSPVFDYYAAPLKVGTFPKYDIENPQEMFDYNGRNRISMKRFMAAKKSRPYGKFLNGMVDQPSISYYNNALDENNF